MLDDGGDPAIIGTVAVSKGRDYSLARRRRRPESQQHRLRLRGDGRRRAVARANLSSSSGSSIPPSTGSMSTRLWLCARPSTGLRALRREQQPLRLKVLVITHRISRRAGDRQPRVRLRPGIAVRSAATRTSSWCSSRRPRPGSPGLGLERYELAPGAPADLLSCRRDWRRRPSSHGPSASSCSRTARSSRATGGSSEPPQRATSSTTFPRLPAAMLRSKALAASSSANTDRSPEAASRRRAARRSAQAAGGWAPPRSTRW